VRRKLPLLLGFAFALAVLRYLRRRREPPAPERPPEPEPASPYAEELRRKLAESREQPEPHVAHDEEPSVEATIEEERQRVHDQARSVLDEMRGPELAEP